MLHCIVWERERAWEVDSVLGTSNEESKELTTWEWKLMNPQWLLFFCFIERSKVFQFFFFILWTFFIFEFFHLVHFFCRLVFRSAKQHFCRFSYFFLLCSKENSIFFYNVCLVEKLVHFGEWYLRVRFVHWPHTKHANFFSIEQIQKSFEMKNFLLCILRKERQKLRVLCVVVCGP